MFIPESAMGGLPSAAAASSLGYVEQVARHYAVGPQLTRERVGRLALAGEARVAQLIRWVNEDDRGASASESITAEAVLRAQRGSFEAYEMLDRKQKLLVVRGVLRLQGTSCGEVLSLLSAKEPSEADAALEDLLGPQLYSASTCLYHTDVDMARVKREASKAANANRRAGVPPAPASSSSSASAGGDGPQLEATVPVKTSLAVQWMAVKDVPGADNSSSGGTTKHPHPLPLREFLFMRFNQSFATAPAASGKRARVSYGVCVWESVDLPTCVPLFPEGAMRRHALKNCGFVVEASEAPGSDTTRVSFFVTAPFDPATADRDSEWLLRVAEGVLHVPSALVNRRIRRNQLRDRRHWAYAGACAVCSAKLGMLSKKHHCRICGGTVCGKCSEMRSDLRTSVLTASARVCSGCLRGDSLTPWSSSSSASAGGSFDKSDRGSVSSVSSWTEFSSRAGNGNGNGRTYSDSTRGSVTSSTYSDGGDNRDRSWSVESFGSVSHVPEPALPVTVVATPTTTAAGLSKPTRVMSAVSSGDRANSSNAATATAMASSPQPMKAVRSVSQEAAAKPTAVPRTKLYRSISTQDGPAAAPTHHRSASHDNYPVPAYQVQPPQVRAAKLERKAGTSAATASSSSSSSNGSSAHAAVASGPTSRVARGVSSAAALASSPAPSSRAARVASSAAVPTPRSNGGAPQLSAHKAARSFSHDNTSGDATAGFTPFQLPTSAVSRGGRSPSLNPQIPGFSIDDDPSLESDRGVAFMIYQAPGSSRQPTRGRSPTSSSGSTGGGLTPPARTVSPVASRPQPASDKAAGSRSAARAATPRSRPQPEAEPSAAATKSTEWGYELAYTKGNAWPDAPTPPTEAERLERIKTLNLSQRFTTTELRELLQFACSSLGCPVGAVSVVAVSTSLLVTTIGLRGDQLPRDLSPDAHVLMSRAPTLVLDTQRDPRFAKNPVVASTNMRFFLGVPLIAKDAAGRDSGVVVGALSLFDTSPRQGVGPDELRALEVVASRIMNKLDSRSAADDEAAAPRSGVLLF